MTEAPEEEKRPTLREHLLTSPDVRATFASALPPTRLVIGWGVLVVGMLALLLWFVFDIRAHSKWGTHHGQRLEFELREIRETLNAEDHRRGRSVQPGADDWSLDDSG